MGNTEVVRVWRASETEEREQQGVQGKQDTEGMATEYPVHFRIKIRRELLKQGHLSKAIRAERVESRESTVFFLLSTWTHTCVAQDDDNKRRQIPKHRCHGP